MYSRPATRRARLHVRTLVAWAAVGLLIAAVCWLWLGRRSAAGQVRAGLHAIARVENRAQLAGALADWERGAQEVLGERMPELVTTLVRRGPATDARIRVLINYLTGADYGERATDWARWHAAWERQQQRGSPLAVRGTRVSLEPVWVAPVGLTTWFSTILPLDDAVFVASLGAAFDDAADAADGVVRVDARSGEATLWFTPPAAHVGPRDVVGLAVNNEGLSAACHNGTVYSLDAAGIVRWSAHAGDPIVAPPLSVDLNHDRVEDVVVATQGHRVVALSGRDGKTVWVTPVSKDRPAIPLLGATLALGPGGATEPRVLVVTFPDGPVAMLTGATGKLTAVARVDAGPLPGAVWTDDARREIWIGDRLGVVRLWRPGLLQLDALGPSPLVWPGQSVVAGVRPMRVMPASGIAETSLTAAVVCLSGSSGEQRSAVSALGDKGVFWQLPVQGTLWGTPAVADLDGDGAAELVICATAPADDDWRTIVAIVSSAGHVIGWHELDAACEASPTVCDVDADGRLNLLIADQQGRLHCFATQGVGPVEFGLVGGDSHNTRNAVNAYAWGQVPPGFRWGWRPP